jgi:hypothetical protein
VTPEQLTVVSIRPQKVVRLQGMSASMMSLAMDQSDTSDLFTLADTDDSPRGPGFGFVVGVSLALPLWSVIGWGVYTIL